MSKRNQMTWDKIFKLEAAIRQTTNQIKKDYSYTNEKRFSMFQPDQKAAVAEYSKLKENIGNEVPISRSRVAYQYAEVRSLPRTQI